MRRRMRPAAGRAGTEHEDARVSPDERALILDDQLLARVNAGSVYWNCCDRVSPRLPWSGYGDSGIGLTLSTHGIQTFTRPKAWHLRKP